MAKTQSPVLVAASANIVRATEALTSAYQQLQTLATQAEDLDGTIAAKNAEIAALDVEFNNRFRQAEVDLSIKVKESVKAIVDEYLTTNNLEAINTADLVSLRKAEKTAIEEGVKSEKAALAAQDKALRTEFNATVEVLKAQHGTTLAQAEANNRSLADKVAFLSQQVQDLLVQLSEQRQAEIDKVKAANPTQHITNVTESSAKK